jgi:tetratricopeptide (TPR) repeat protein
VLEYGMINMTRSRSAAPPRLAPAPRTLPALLALVLLCSIATVGCVPRPSADEAPAAPSAAPAEPLIAAPRHPGGLHLVMSQAFLNRGIQLVELGALAAAVESFSDALVADPGNARIYYLRASVQLQRQRPLEAIADLSKAIKAGAQPNYFLSRCGAYMITGAWDQAISDCTDTIQMAPMEADAYLLRAMTYHSSGQLEKALADALVVLMIRPGNANAKNLVDEILADRERRDRGYATTPMIKTEVSSG